MNRLHISLIITIIVVLMAGHVKAQIITDRPDQTESSSTVGHGSLQIEAGLVTGFEGEGPNSTRQILAPTTLFRYGISEAIELRLVSQFETLKILDQKTQGISDIEIGVKVQIFKSEDSRTEVALITHLLVPTGTKELSGDSFGSINKLAASLQINDRLGLGSNLGYNYLGTGRGDLTYSLVLGIAVNQKVGIYIEPYGEVLDMSDFILNSDTGLTYLVKENLQLDFSFGTGLNQRMNFISLGCSWKIMPG